MRFKYKARSKEGKLRKGYIEASSYKSALYVLEKYGLFVINVKQIEKQSFFSKRVIFSGISLKDITMFTRQLSIMLKSAISPVDALRAQVVQTDNHIFREKILKMAERIEGGTSLSHAFGLFPKVFNQFFVSVIRSGEATGKVSDSLNYLADHLEREYNLKQNIKGAMIYPIIVIIAFVIMIFLASFLIVPRLTEIFDAFGGELPAITKMIIVLSDFVTKGGWILILFLLFILFLTPRYIKTKRKYKKVYDKFLLKIPIMGPFIKKIYLTRFAQNLSVLIAAGLPITQALKITKGIIESTVYSSIIEEAEESVSKGERISSVFAKYPKEIPSFVLQMILTGEETGRLDEILLDVVKFYRQEVERTTENLTSILEPVLILFLGAGITVLAVAVFIPLFKIGMGGMGM